MAEVDLVEDAYILCRDETVEAIGRMRDLGPLGGEVIEIDGRGFTAIPGLVDCHTHPAFGGDRVDEFSLRAAGLGYEEIHARGGGISATVQATRRLAAEDLREAVETHRGWMAAQGTTTFEGKSGYGLDRDTEIASLRAIRDAGGVPTWLGAHATPPDFDTSDEYLDFALQEVLPLAAAIAEAADVFIERGAFSVDQARRYLLACRAAGLTLRIHGDQFSEIGALPLAIELGARSVDHLEATGAEGVAALGESSVTAVLLPASALFLGRPMPRGRELIDAGAALAVATDFNPGSAFCESMPLCASLAVMQCGLSPAEALAACTVNAAHVLRRADVIGRIRPGHRADVVLLDATDWRYLVYHLGADIVARTIVAGRPSP
jgi:imidazolonepropionase